MQTSLNVFGLQLYYYIGFFVLGLKITASVM